MVKAAGIVGKKIFVALGLMGLIVLPLATLAGQQRAAFADGLFQEHIQGNIAGRDVQLFVRVNPPILTTQTQQDAFVQLRLFEGNNQTIKFTTFVIQISKVTDSEEEVLMTADAFHTESGLLTLKIQPREGPVQIFATREDFLNAWKADPGGTINIRGPILLEGGLYHFRIEVIGVDFTRQLLPPDQVKTFDSYLSVGDVMTQEVQYQGNTYPVTIISYYDQVQDFIFDVEKKMFAWSMPFNWNVDRIRSTNIFVHEEVKIPKSFQGIADTGSFTATVNGEPISGRMLVVDPFSSENELILHYLLNKNDILSMAQEVPDGTSAMTFTLAPATGANAQTTTEMATDTGGINVLTEWTPSQLSADTESTLKLDFSDAFSGTKITADVLYDIRILDSDGNQVYSKSDLTAKGGTDTQTIDFPSNENYRIEVQVNGLVQDGQPVDRTRNGIARGIVVVPEFPPGAVLAFAGVIGVVAVVLAQRLGFMAGRTRASAAG